MPDPQWEITMYVTMPTCIDGEEPFTSDELKEWAHETARDALRSIQAANNHIKGFGVTYEAAEYRDDRCPECGGRYDGHYCSKSACAVWKKKVPS